MTNALELTPDDEKLLADLEATFAYTLVFSSAQFELLLIALSDAYDDAQLAMEDEPYGKDEIQPYADGFNELMRKLLDAKARKANPWRPAQAQPAISRPDDSLTMRQFAAREGIPVHRAYTLAGQGRILGLFRMLRSRQWMVCSHGELVEAAAEPERSSEAPARRSSASAVDFGTSPHGLGSSGRSDACCGVQPSRRKDKRANPPSLKAGVSRTAKPKAVRPGSPRPGRGSPGTPPANSWLAMLPGGMP